jgi:hypothetical protein
VRSARRPGDRLVLMPGCQLTRLPAHVYRTEPGLLRSSGVHLTLHPDSLRQGISQHNDLGNFERVVPWVVVLISVAEIVRQSTR